MIQSIVKDTGLCADIIPAIGKEGAHAGSAAHGSAETLRGVAAFDFVVPTGVQGVRIDKITIPFDIQHWEDFAAEHRLEESIVFAFGGIIPDAPLLFIKQRFI